VVYRIHAESENARMSSMTALFILVECQARLPEGHARLRLVLAYASYSLGKYLIADAMLREVQLQRKDLSEADVSFLNLLSNAMAMHTGRIDYDEYLRREEDLISGGHPLLRAQHRLRVLRVAVLREQKAGVRSEMIDEVRGIVHEIESSEASRHFKVEVQLLLLELEVRENIRRFRDFAIKLWTRDISGRPLLRSEIELSREQSQQAEQRWRSMADTILRHWTSQPCMRGAAFSLHGFAMTCSILPWQRWRMWILW
jgi:hypothetical protein